MEDLVGQMLMYSVFDIFAVLYIGADPSASKVDGMWEPSRRSTTCCKSSARLILIYMPPSS